MERRYVSSIAIFILAILLGLVSCDSFKRTPKHEAIDEGSSIAFGDIRVAGFLFTNLPDTTTGLFDGHSWKTAEGKEFGYLIIRMNHSSLDFREIENRFHKKTVYKESEMNYIKARWTAVYSQFDGRAMPPVSFSDKVFVSSWGSGSEDFEVFGSKSDGVTLLFWSFSK